MQSFRKRHVGLSATPGLSCINYCMYHRDLRDVLQFRLYCPLLIYTTGLSALSPISIAGTESTEYVILGLNAISVERHMMLLKKIVTVLF